MNGLWLLVASAAVALALWSLIRGDRTTQGLLVTTVAFAVVGGAGALVESDLAKAIGQTICLGITGLAAGWITGKSQIARMGDDGGRRRSPLRAARVPTLGGNVWFVILLAGILSFLMWVVDTYTLLFRILITASVSAFAASTILLGRSRSG